MISQDNNIFKIIQLLSIVIAVLLLTSCSQNTKKDKVEFHVTRLALGNVGENRVIEVCKENEAISIYSEIEIKKDSFEKVKYSLSNELEIINKETWDYAEKISTRNSNDCYGGSFSIDTNKLTNEDGSWIEIIAEHDPFNENKILMKEYDSNEEVVNEYTYSEVPILYDLIKNENNHLEIVGDYLIVAEVNKNVAISSLTVYEYDDLFNSQHSNKLYELHIPTGYLLPLGEGKYIIYPDWYKEMIGNPVSEDQVIYLDDTATKENSPKIFMINFNE